MTTTQTDILIIGAGPAGLFAGFYAGMRDLSVRIVDSLPQVGGQPQALYPKKKIYDIPGFPEITGEELTQNLVTQLERFSHQTYFSLNQEVIDLKKHRDYFEVHTTKDRYTAKTILIAAGNGSFKPRQIKLENMDNFTDSIDYYLPEIETITDKTIAICGGGDTAFDTAIQLADYAKKIYLIHRREAFRAHEYSVSLAKQKENIHFITPYVPKALLGNEEKLTAIHLNPVRENTQEKLEIDHLIMAYGFVSSISAIRDWGLTIQNNRIQVDQHMQTAIEGIFSIGDIVTYPGKADLIATAFGEAPTVINTIKQYLNPDMILKPLHSSELPF